MTTEATSPAKTPSSPNELSEFSDPEEFELVSGGQTDKFKQGKPITVEERLDQLTRGVSKLSVCLEKQTEVMTKMMEVMVESQKQSQMTHNAIGEIQKTMNESQKMMAKNFKEEQRERIIRQRILPSVRKYGGIQYKNGSLCWSQYWLMLKNALVRIGYKDFVDQYERGDYSLYKNEDEDGFLCRIIECTMHNEYNNWFNSLRVTDGRQELTAAFRLKKLSPQSTKFDANDSFGNLLKDCPESPTVGVYLLNVQIVLDYIKMSRTVDDKEMANLFFESLNSDGGLGGFRDSITAERGNDVEFESMEDYIKELKRYGEEGGEDMSLWYYTPFNTYRKLYDSCYSEKK